jgi:hypothetical protein
MLSKPTVTLKKGNDLAISGEVLLELMQKVLAEGAAFKFRAKGWSMIPFIKDGDVITVSPAGKAKPAVGKVVAFRQPQSGNLVVHRVIGWNDNAFLIQGDNATGEPDGLVIPQDILGCVTRVERNGRRIFIGQGPERFLMAFLARNKLLNGVVRRIQTIVDIFYKEPY